MPLRNRVTPLGELVAVRDRGLVYGNRGCLHDASGEIRRGWAGKRWIACRLEFRGWRRAPLVQPGRFTELFFLDEATAMAAGHRPCALCRHEDYLRFRELWTARHGPVSGVDAIDDVLHGERLDGRRRRLHPVPLAELPDGAFVQVDGNPCLVLGDRLLPWTPEGYAAALPRPAPAATLAITPPSLVEVLRRGWEGSVTLFHPSAAAAA